MSPVHTLFVLEAGLASSNFLWAGLFTGAYSRAAERSFFQGIALFLAWTLLYPGA
jgi:hypothetical protein